jgi:hypothetical protein
MLDRTSSSRDRVSGFAAKRDRAFVTEGLCPGLTVPSIDGLRLDWLIGTAFDFRPTSRSTLTASTTRPLAELRFKLVGSSSRTLYGTNGGALIPRSDEEAALRPRTQPNGTERVRNIDPLLVLPKNSRQRGAREIGRFDSVSLSAGIQVTALIGRGQKPRTEVEAGRTVEAAQKEPGNGSAAMNSRRLGLTR